MEEGEGGGGGGWEENGEGGKGTHQVSSLDATACRRRDGHPKGLAIAVDKR